MLVVALVGIVGAGVLLTTKQFIDDPYIVRPQV